MDHIEELSEQFNEARDELASHDVAIDFQEMKLLNSERYSTKWMQNLEQLKKLHRERQMIASRLFLLRKRLDMESLKQRRRMKQYSL